MEEPEIVFFARSKDQNIRFANNIKKSYKVLFFDLFQYQEIPFDISYIKKFDNIIITSRKAAEIISNIAIYKNFLVVGQSSYEVLKDFGPVKVFNNIEELENYKVPQNSIYLSGSIITKEIDAKRIIIYDTIYKDSLPTNIKKNLPYITHLLLFSTVNAVKILNLIEPYISKNCKITAISEKVAKVCKEKNFLYVSIDPFFRQFIK